MKAREGDLIETADGLIFDVKGLVHPPDRIVAFPRFVPEPNGNRRRESVTYKKVYALSERYRFLEEHFPQYLVLDPVFGERLCEIPTKDVKHHYDPIDRLMELRGRSHPGKLESDALHFAELLQNNSTVPWKKLGISGSLLAQLHTQKSDIDPIVIGERNCARVCEALRAMMKDEKSPVKAYTNRDLGRLYNFRIRDTEMRFDDFLITEGRKVLQGTFLHRDFYIRCVKDWNEIEEMYGDVICRRVGYAKIKATISDDSEATFTPCRYGVHNIRVLKGKCEAVSEISSFRGRFCEQARKGEMVIAQGKVEKMLRENGDTSFRLLLGGKPSDFMVLERRTS